MKKLTVVLLLAVTPALLSGVWLQAQTMKPVIPAEGQNSASPRDYLVGVYYFAGWWQKSPNKWTTAGHDWRPDYPGRIPTLGQYNDQQTMDQEILAAANHGVDFFQILWYPNGGPLNEGLRLFLASTNSGRMKFTIEFVNHPPFEAQGRPRSFCEIVPNEDFRMRFFALLTRSP